MARHQQIVAVYVVRAEAGALPEFLQLRRAADDFMGGTWGAVSGGLEPGETAWRGALRELREEAGLVPSEFFRLPTTRSFYTAHDDTIMEVIGFCAIVPPDAQVILSREHTEFRWITREQVATHFIWPIDRELIEELCGHILPAEAVTRELLRVLVD